MKGDKLKVTFYGGTGTVTGANFLVETTDLKENIKFLVDCGLFQGAKIGEEKNMEKFPYDPSEIDFLFVTHAHIDHTGRIPKLVRDGFKGKIYSTPPTMDISGVMLEDSMGVLGKEAKRDNHPPIYERKDVERAMQLWHTFDFHEQFNIGPIGVRFLISGHVLGSAMIELTYNGKKMVFTGDLGNTPSPLLRDTEKLKDVNYLIMESVYGDRNHEHVETRTEVLENIIEDSCRRGGTLMIPAFSLERTQEMIYEIERMMEEKRIPVLPVYLDSPLAIKVTRFYKKYSKQYFNPRAKDYMKDDEIFKFPQLKMTLETEESKAIDRSNEPKIIIAGSGMSNGGRIVHHEKRFLPDSKSTLLLVGYQAVRTLGRRLLEGAKHVKIYGDDIPVRAKIEMIGGYSAHKDSDDLLEFVADTADTLEEVYCVMGEPKSSMFLAQRINDYLGVKATVPEEAAVVEFQF